jgi:hypothetical protein
MSTATGELRYRLRCLDELGFTFRGDEAALDAGFEEGLERLPPFRPLLSYNFAVA